MKIWSPWPLLLDPSLSFLGFREKKWKTTKNSSCRSAIWAWWNKQRSIYLNFNHTVCSDLFHGLWTVDLVALSFRWLCLLITNCWYASNSLDFTDLVHWLSRVGPFFYQSFFSNIHRIHVLQIPLQCCPLHEILKSFSHMTVRKMPKRLEFSNFQMTFK